MHTSSIALLKEHLVPVLTFPLERTTLLVMQNKEPQPETKNDEKDHYERAGCNGKTSPYEHSVKGSTSLMRPISLDKTYVLRTFLHNNNSKVTDRK